MKVLIVLALAASVAACATPPQPGAQTITVAAGRIKQCKEQGGCVLLTSAEVLGMLSQAAQSGVRACRAGAL